jgi:hypothetical protein
MYKCPCCERKLSIDAFYCENSTYCIECENKKQKKRYAKARDIKLDLISEYDNRVIRNLKLLDILLNETKQLADKRSELSKLYKLEKVKKFIAKVEDL